MSEIQDCSCPCPTIAPVNVPGTAGQPAFTYTTGVVSVPSTSGSTVAVQVLSTTPFFVGEIVVVNGVSGAGTGTATFLVTTINSATLMTLTWLQYAGDLTGASTINSGALVVNIGKAGTAGTAGAPGYATVTAPFTGGSSAGQISTVSVSNAALFPVNITIVITNAAGQFQTFTVNSINTVANTITIEWLDAVGDTAGASYAAGNLIVISATPGLNAFSVTTAATSPVDIPAAGSSQTFTVNETSWMTVGATVVTVSGGLPAHYQVTTISSSTSVILTFLGYFGDVAGGSTNSVAMGSVVAPSGPQPFASTALSSFSLGTPAPLSSTVGAALTFGTTTPSITLTPGTWILNMTAIIGIFTQSSTAGAIFVFLYNATGAVTIANSGCFVNVSASATTLTDLPLAYSAVVITVTANQTIIFWGYQTHPSGTVANVNSASIVAHRIA